MESTETLACDTFFPVFEMKISHLTHFKQNK